MNPEELSRKDFYDRMLAHDGHTDTSPAMLLLMYSMNDTGLQLMALAHENFPFNLRFLHELKTYPVSFPVSEFACVTDRAEDYKKFLTELQLTVEDIAVTPKAWLVAFLEK